MQYVPHEYQEYAERFIIEHPACGLFLDLGLGKTVITLNAIDNLMFDYFDVSRVLVIAPLRVAQDTWSRECEKWEHLRHLKISKVLGSEKERRLALNRQADIYIINRENVEWLTKEYKCDFDMVVIDELSSFKSPSAKRFKALRKIRPQIKRVVGLTGTPVPNSLIDLWSQIYMLDMGARLGRLIGNYRRDYFEPDKQNGQVIFTYKPKASAEEAIYRKISDICVSMKAGDYIRMPERVDNRIVVSMTDKEMALYKRLEREMLLPFAGGDIDAVNAAALANKLLQMANGAVYDENKAVRLIHNKKLDALEDLWEGANGKPLLVFYAYRHDRDRLAEFFQDKGVTPREIDKPEDISDWNEGKIEIAIAHPASAGHGLNLQAGGNTIVWFGLTWSLELYQQANGRLYRQGQNQTVIVHHIITAGTIDEQVIAALGRKETGQTALIDAVKAKLRGEVGGY